MTSTITKPMLNNIDPKHLKPHPLNEKIYNDKPDEEFIESCADGIIEPINITKDNHIISGHRRHYSALELEMDTVPVLIRYDLQDPLEVERALILANKHREKTNEQKAREFKELKRIQAELAKERKDSTKFKKGSVNTKGESGSHGAGNVSHTVESPEDTVQPSENVGVNTNKKARSSDVAAAEVGWSGRTGDAAEEVVDAIDAAEESGDKESADDLRETLEKKGVHPAKKKAEEKKREASSKPAKQRTEAQNAVFQKAAPFRSLITRIGKMKTEFEELKGEAGTGCEFINAVTITDFNTRAENLKGLVQDVMPKECSSCEGEGCKLCKFQGYVRSYS